MNPPTHPDRYYVTWKIERHTQGLTREEVEALEDRSAAHDVIVFSIIHGADGSLSTLINSHSHEDRELTANEYFKAWMLFTELVRRKLTEAGAPNHKGSKLDLVTTVWEAIVAGILHKEPH